MEHDERFDTLRRCLPQKTHSDELVATLVDHCCELDVAQGTILVNVGQTVTEVYVLLAGKIEIRGPSGPPSLIEPGTVVGVSGVVVDDEPQVSGFTAVALSHLTVLVVPLAGSTSE